MIKPTRALLDSSVTLWTEPRWKRWSFLLLTLVILAGFGFFLASYWAPAPGHPGIDENAYLLGGRNIVEHHTVGWKPTDNYQFVGHMWFRTEDQTHEPPHWLPEFLRRKLTVHTEAGWYYPKYPAGLPLLNAMLIAIGGVAHGRELAFVLSPACMFLTGIGMFLLGRAIVGSFYGLLGTIVLLTGPTSLMMAEIPNSHAPSLCMVVWGMFFLVRWVQSGSVWRGALAGFLLGYAVTIRYSEALLLFPFYPLDQIFSKEIPQWSHAMQMLVKAAKFLPVGPLGLAALMSVRWTRPLTWWRGIVPIITWGIPVGLLVAYTWFSTGQITGYDATHESSGFSVREFLDKWDFTIFQLYVYGLFVFLPLGIAGIVMMYRTLPRVALLLTMWFLPSTLLYMTYYWGDNTPGVAYLRFFLTIMAPVIIGGMWLLRSASAPGEKRGSITGPLAAGILTAAAAGIGLFNSIGEVNRQYRGNENLHYSEAQLASHIKGQSKPPVIFADNGMFPQFLQYGQFMIDADWYANDVFEPRVGGGFGIFGMFQKDTTDQGGPVLIQQDRIDYMDAFRKGKSDEDFITDAHHMMDQALAGGRKIYLLDGKEDAVFFGRRFITGSYRMKQIDTWKEPCAVVFPSAREENHLALASWSGQPFFKWQPQALTLYEISKAK
ncbi:MAG TPA: glycosyltransferase family 39 protein [Tepidisphaeraceae bacterium]